MARSLISTEFLLSLFQVRFRVIGFDREQNLYRIQNIEPMKCGLDNTIIQQQVREGMAWVEGETLTALIEREVIDDCIRLERTLSQGKQ